MPSEQASASVPGLLFYSVFSEIVLIKNRKIYVNLSKTIDLISAVYTAPADMREKWELSHQNYVEKLARIKAMLNL